MWRWFDPLEELKRMQDRIERFLGEMERRRGIFPGEFMDFPVDVIDEGDKIRIIAELPGFKKEDIEVNIENSYLVIKGERKEEKEEKGRGYIKQERRFGEMSRRVSIPHDIKMDEIKATYNNGVLEITIPKAEPSKRKTIKID